MGSRSPQSVYGLMVPGGNVRNRVKAGLAMRGVKCEQHLSQKGQPRKKDDNHGD